MNDITRKRAQRVIERQVADGSLIRLGDGQTIERDRRAQQTASQAVIMTSTTDGQTIERDRRAQQTASQAVIMTSSTGHGAHLIRSGPLRQQVLHLWCCS